MQEKITEYTYTKQRTGRPVSSENAEVGLIQEDWKVVRLEDVLQKGKTTINPQNYPDEVFELYSIPVYHESKKPELVKGKEVRSQKLLIQNNIVLFGKINPRLPKIWFVLSNEPCRKIASTEFIPLLSNSRSEPRFIYYLAWSNYLLEKSKSLTSGTTPSRKRVDVKAFLKLPIPLPPFPEQQKIAKVLGTIQRVIEQQDKIIEAAKYLKKSLMQKLFTEGIGHTEFNDTEIGQIPKSWEVVKLGDVVEKHKNSIKRGPWGSSLRKAIFVTAGYKVYEQGNVIHNDFSIGSYFITREKFHELRDFAIEEGDILLTASGTIGRTAIVPRNFQPGIINQALIKISVDESIMLASFLNFLFNYENLQGRVLGTSHGTAMKNISTVEALKSIELPLPPLPEQQEMAHTLRRVDDKIQVEEKRKTALQQLFKTMLHKLMTGEIRLKDIEV